MMYDIAPEKGAFTFRCKADTRMINAVSRGGVKREAVQHLLSVDLDLLGKSSCNDRQQTVVLEVDCKQRSHVPQTCFSAQPTSFPSLFTMNFT